MNMGQSKSKRENDPFSNITNDILEFMLSFFTTNELLAATLVNKQWNEFIGGSSKCMKKLEVKFHDKGRITNEDVMIFVNSPREYSAISIREREISSQLRLIIGSYQWKTVELCNMRFVWDIHFLDFVGLFKPWAENLTFFDVGIMAERAQNDTDYVWPKLKNLTIRKSSRVIVRRVFTECTTLQGLFLGVCQYNDPESAAVVASIQNLLIRCVDMKNLHLGLYTPLFNSIFTEDFVENVNFKLHSLKLMKFQRTHQFQNMLAFENLGVFLLKQADTLRGIYLKEWMGQNIINIIFSAMNKIETATIKDLHLYGIKEDLEFMALNKNTTIKCLNIYTYISIDKCFEWILKSVPNLRVLKMYTLTANTLSQLKRYNPKLDHLHLDCLLDSQPIADFHVFCGTANTANYFFISKQYKKELESSPVSRRSDLDWKFISMLDGCELHVKR